VLQPVADDHAQEIIRVYPKRDGMRTKFITGNHDSSLIRLAGIDIGRMIAAERSDNEYLGHDSAVIQLTDNCTLELRHPGDGTAYALSYKPQKIIEAMSGGEKPHILALATTTRPSTFTTATCMRSRPDACRHRHRVMRGKESPLRWAGVIVEVKLNVDGGIERLQSAFIPFYTAIKDDWKNWR
jgi:hypothetical protein